MSFHIFVIFLAVAALHALEVFLLWSIRNVNQRLIEHIFIGSFLHIVVHGGVYRRTRVYHLIVAAASCQRNDDGYSSFYLLSIKVCVRTRDNVSGVICRYDAIYTRGARSTN